MKNSKNGFAIPLIIAIIAVLVAGGGTYYYKKTVQVPAQAPAQNQNQTQNQNLIGGDKDAHGCLGPAGYSWCEAKQKCLRTWEEKCEAVTTATGDKPITNKKPTTSKEVKTSTVTGTSGIKGVLLYGPTSHDCATQYPNGCTKPYSSYLNVSKKETNDISSLVGTTFADDSGRFAMDIPVGNYNIDLPPCVPGNRCGDYPSMKTTSVVVSAGNHTEIRLMVDSGVR
jgi:hypothetical protein